MPCFWNENPWLLQSIFFQNATRQVRVALDGLTEGKVGRRVRDVHGDELVDGLGAGSDSRVGHGKNPALADAAPAQHEQVEAEADGDVRQVQEVVGCRQLGSAEA